MRCRLLISSRLLHLLRRFAFRGLFIFPAFKFLELFYSLYPFRALSLLQIQYPFTSCTHSFPLINHILMYHICFFATFYMFKKVSESFFTLNAFLYKMLTSTFWWMLICCKLSQVFCILHSSHGNDNCRQTLYLLKERKWRYPCIMAA